MFICLCLTWGHGFLCCVLDVGPRFPLHHLVWEHSGWNRILACNPCDPLYHTGHFSDTFIITTPTDLGVIQEIILRHDAFGLAPRWFVGRVEVTNLRHSESLRIFWIDNWLALDISDGLIERHAVGESKTEAATFSHVFALKTKRAFSDKHTFGSVLFAPPNSPFSRAERTGVCALFLLFSMFTSAMFYHQADHTELTLGQTIYVGFISSLITVVPLAMLVYIFKHSAIPSSRFEDSATRLRKNRIVPAAVRHTPNGKKQPWSITSNVDLKDLMAIRLAK
jgi:hypothetical protein